MRPSPRALVPLLALAAACAGEPPARVGDGRHRSTLLITLDTTRQDALGCYGHRPSVTPTLDAFAEECVVYARARTVAPLTVPAHASMLTGLYPSRHHVRDGNLHSLGPAAETLAELAQERGYQTAAFLGTAALGGGSGLDQGFDHYDAPRPPRARAAEQRGERPAEDVVDAALAWLTGRDPERPFLVWVHLFDPHEPYEPEPEHLVAAGGNAYLAEVRRTDAALERLFEALRADPIWSETVVLVAGDHGEGLGEHGEPTHGPWVFDSTLRVPFLLRQPGGRRTGELSREVVSVVDVFPTLVEATGLGRAEGVDGVSLLEPVPEDRAVYFESYQGYLNYGWSPLAGVADGELKTIFAHGPTTFRPYEDPAELERLTGPEVIAVVARHRDVLASVLALPEEPPGDEASGPRSPELPHPLEPDDRPDPLERVDEYLELQRAIALLEAGRTSEALASLHKITLENDGNLLAHDVLAGALVGEKSFHQALPLLRRLVLEQPTASRCYNLAGCLEALGDSREAVKCYRAAVAMDPDHLPSLRRLVALVRPPVKGSERLVEEIEGYRRRIRELTGR